MREQIVLVTLGLPSDIPVGEIVEHMATCAACREWARSVHETAGILPEALQPKAPPSHLREKVLEAATSGGERADHSQATPPFTPFPDHIAAARRDAGTRRGSRTIAWAAAVILLLAGHAALLWHTGTQHRALLALQSRYDAEVNWLRSAEYLLVRGEPPTYRSLLHIPDAREPGVEFVAGSEPEGRAAIYETPSERLYLLVRAEGLREASPYTVWFHVNSDRHLIGDFTSTPTGTGAYVYAVDAAEWSDLSLDRVVIGIRDETTQTPVLTGTWEVSVDSAEDP